MNFIVQNQILIAAGLLLLAILILAWLVLDLRRKWRRVFKNKPKREALGEILEHLAAHEDAITHIGPRLDALEAIGNIAIQKTGFMRFNPFEHTGGDQSFALALLDHENNGVVLSSLYMRDGVRLYAKQIIGGSTKYQLSEEETAVLEQAITRTTNHPTKHENRKR